MSSEDQPGEGEIVELPVLNDEERESADRLADKQILRAETSDIEQRPIRPPMGREFSDIVKSVFDDTARRDKVKPADEIDSVPENITPFPTKKPQPE